jgi:cytochrome b pre-mRNA-processing protein 3
MKEMGEQWKGAGIGFDYAIAVGQDLPELSNPNSSSIGNTGVGKDAELAAWVWRNLFAARYSDLPSDFTPSTTTSKTTPAAGATENDPYTTSPSIQSDPSNPITHLKLPIHLNTITTFIRRELHRLDQLTDEEIEQGKTGEFGSVKEVVGRRGGEETVDGA